MSLTFSLKSVCKNHVALHAYRSQSDQDKSERTVKPNHALDRSVNVASKRFALLSPSYDPECLAPSGAARLRLSALVDLLGGFAAGRTTPPPLTHFGVMFR